MQLSRALTFLFGCILMRIIIAYIVFLSGNNSNKTYLILLGCLGFFIGIGFLSIYINGGNKTADNQLKNWNDDTKLWWHQLRLFHAITYLLFFISTVVYRSNKSYLFLVLDVIVGLIAWILHNTLAINFV